MTAPQTRNGDALLAGDRTVIARVSTDGPLRAQARPNAELLAASSELYVSLLEIVADWGNPSEQKLHRAQAALARAAGDRES